MDEKLNLTLNDLVNDNADLYISFHHCGDLQSAYNKLKPYTKFGSINKYSSADGTVWVKIESEINQKTVEFIAFL